LSDFLSKKFAISSENTLDPDSTLISSLVYLLKYMYSFRIFLINLSLFGFFAVSATAQTEPAPYEKDMLRLSEILGALHYLRPLCGAQDDNAWRMHMQALLDTESSPADWRERLAGAFNAGFESFQHSYTRCTSSADVATRRFLTEGARLSRDTALRYGN
jgi:uncharacterized protein (TIGR02301 family)